MPGGFVHGRVVFMVAQGCPGYCHVPKIIILRKSPPHPWPAIRQCFSACILYTSTFAVLGRQIRAEKEAGAGEYAGIVCGQGGVETPRREVTSEGGIEKRTRRRRRREAQLHHLLVGRVLLVVVGVGGDGDLVGGVQGGDVELVVEEVRRQREILGAAAAWAEVDGSREVVVDVFLGVENDGRITDEETEAFGRYDGASFAAPEREQPDHHRHECHHLTVPQRGGAQLPKRLEALNKIVNFLNANNGGFGHSRNN
nr:hypothetical protein Iba_chr12cCG7080 [Ipomoea batatas]